MIDTIKKQIIERLKGLNLFKVVSDSIHKQPLQSTPSAVLYLSADREKTDNPQTTRTLHWDIFILLSAMGQDQGHNLAGTYLDAVRDAFAKWVAIDSGGVMPAKVPFAMLEGQEKTLLVYSVRVTMDVIPANIKTS